MTRTWKSVSPVLVSAFPPSPAPGPGDADGRGATVPATLPEPKGPAARPYLFLIASSAFLPFPSRSLKLSLWQGSFWLFSAPAL